MEFSVRPIGRVASPLRNREDAPKQGEEGAPPAVLVFERPCRLRWPISGSVTVAPARHGLIAPIEVCCKFIRETTRRCTLRGVFSTRSQDRPNPIGVHRVTVVSIASPLRFEVRDCEAFDGTPIVDVKATLAGMVGVNTRRPWRSA